MPDNEPKSGVWTKYFEAANVSALEDGLAAVLALQAERVQDLMGREKPVKYTDQVKRDIEIDKQLDKIFKNGLALRNAKVPRAVVNRRPAARAVESTREDVPEVPTSQMVALAMRELEELGYQRSNITPGDVREHLRAQRAITAGEDGDNGVF